MWATPGLVVLFVRPIFVRPIFVESIPSIFFIYEEKSAFLKSLDISYKFLEQYLWRPFPCYTKSFLFLRNHYLLFFEQISITGGLQQFLPQKLFCYQDTLQEILVNELTRIKSVIFVISFVLGWIWPLIIFVRIIISPVSFVWKIDLKHQWNGSW